MFSDLSSEEIREIFREISEDMRAEMSARPPRREKPYFADWPAAHFTREEIRAALREAWQEVISP